IGPRLDLRDDGRSLPVSGDQRSSVVTALDDFATQLLDGLCIELIVRSEQRTGVDFAIKERYAWNSGKADDRTWNDALNSRKLITQTRDTLQRLGRVHA